MFGILLGDIAGSVYEFDNYKGNVNNLKLFTADNFFTDDTILALATLRALNVYKDNHKKLREFYIDTLHDYYALYPNLTWGGNFKRWASNKLRTSYNSKGNGAAVRALPIALVAKDERELKKLSYIITAVTHSHDLGIKYTEALVLAVYLLKTTKDKVAVRERIERDYFKLDFDVAELRKSYRYSELIENCVPQALVCFFEASTFDDALRNAISIGGDTDTITAMVGALAEAFYGITKEQIATAVSYFSEYDYKLLVDLQQYYL